jgi:hypothetical protein
MPKRTKRPARGTRKRVETVLRQLDKANLTPDQRERLFADVYDFVMRWVEREDIQHEM